MVDKSFTDAFEIPYYYSGDLIIRDNSIFRALRLEEVPENAVLNLDVSSMIAYVSALTNGRANFRSIFGEVVPQYPDSMCFFNVH